VTLGCKFPEGIRKTETTVYPGQRKPFVREDKTMKSPNLATEAKNMPTGIRSSVPVETSRNGPSFAEIRQRARQIHIERGAHVCEMNNYLDEWLQAEHELQEKYNKSSGE
jgi:hypothetical protein